MKQARNLIAPLLPIPMIRIAACPAGSSAYHRDSNVRGSSAYPPRLSVNADILFGNPVPGAATRVIRTRASRWPGLVSGV